MNIYSGGYPPLIFSPQNLSLHVNWHLIAENEYLGGWYCHRCGLMFGEYAPDGRCTKGVPVYCPLPDCTIHPHAANEPT